MPERKKTKSFFQMSLAEKEEFARVLEKGIPARRLKPLSDKDKVLWQAAKRSRGLPRRSNHTKAIPIRVAFEPQLLKAIDACATKNGISRDELLARGAKLALTGAPAQVSSSKK